MKWKIFIVTHGPIIEDYYKNDLLFSEEHYTFFNVSDIPITHKKFNVINKSEITNFIHLGKWYAEGEAIYNIYKNNLYKEYDYIGFIHWDFELKSINHFIGVEISNLINKCIDQGEKFISFETYSFSQDYAQKIMMDENFPNHVVGDGHNCYEEIIKDYNNFYNENVEIDFLMTKRINLCSAFLSDKSVFEILMPFYSWIIESKKLDKYNFDTKYRFQGGMLERYIGCFSHKYSLSEIPLFHRSINISYEKTNECKIPKRLLRKIFQQWFQFMKK
jgi:hypothetical protein